MQKFVASLIITTAMAVLPTFGAEQGLRIGLYDKSVAAPEIQQIQQESDQKVKTVMEVSPSPSSPATPPAAETSIPSVSASVLDKPVEERNKELKQITELSASKMIPVLSKLKQSLGGVAADKFDVILDKNAVLYSEVPLPTADLTDSVVQFMSGKASTGAEAAHPPLQIATSRIGTVDTSVLKFESKHVTSDQKFLDTVKAVALQKGLKLAVDASGISYSAKNISPDYAVDLTKEVEDAYKAAR
jgi:Skp family chaperone for outer membrane proteins